MKIGFTGSQTLRTAEQAGWLYALIEGKKLEVPICEWHHGACIGADAMSHVIAERHNVPIVIHPPINQSKMAMYCVSPPHPLVTVLPAKHYIARNHDIVDDTEMLVALPDSMEEKIRSGTWATIRYALKQRKPVLICYPNGTWEWK